MKRMALLAALAFVFPACSDRSDRDTTTPPAIPSEQPERTQPRDGATTPPPAPAPGPQSSVRDDVGSAGAEMTGSPADEEVTRSIRQALTSDDSLSTAAQNVTITAAEGVVTLKGEVQNEQEKSRIEAIAKQTAGVQRVDSEIKVTS